VKGDRSDAEPQGFTRQWDTVKYTSKTQHMVLELVTRLPQEGKDHVI